MLTPEERRAFPKPSSFYAAFMREMEAITIKADAPAAAVVGECIRAAKRAQMWIDGDYETAPLHPAREQDHESDSDEQPTS